MIEQELPTGWAQSTIEGLIYSDGVFKDGDWVESKDQDPNGAVRLIQLADIGDGRFINKSSRFLTSKKAEELNCTFLRKGDVLVARMPDPLGRACIFPLEGDSKHVTVVDVCVVRTGSSEIDNKFLMFLINSTSIRSKISALQSGSTRKRISRKNLSTIELPIPPLNEQKRIVAKIEELFSELDNGIAALKTAREQLKVYRQAVLKHAFEGKLTEKWREENTDKLESPEKLLARIQQEREARYAQQLEDWKDAVKEWEERGKEGKKPGKPKKLEPQGDPDENYKLRLKLPSIWSPCCIGQAYSVYVGATPSRKETTYWNGDIFWVSSGEVSFCEITDTAERITVSGYKNTSTEVHPPGTVLLAMIGEGKTRGQAAITRVAAAHNQNTAAIRVSEAKLSPEYLYYFLQYQYEQTRRVGSGNNQKALNKARVSSIEFPLCSNAEQLEVVSRLSERLSVVENIEREIDDSLVRSETLRQSILKKAFSGQLVPQDANDEPASELLARIQAEKEAEKAKNTKSNAPAKRARKTKPKQSA